MQYRGEVPSFWSWSESNMTSVSVVSGSGVGSGVVAFFSLNIRRWARGTLSSSSSSLSFCCAALFFADSLASLWLLLSSLSFLIALFFIVLVRRRRRRSGTGVCFSIFPLVLFGWFVFFDRASRSCCSVDFGAMYLCYVRSGVRRVPWRVQISRSNGRVSVALTSKCSPRKAEHFLHSAPASPIAFYSYTVPKAMSFFIFIFFMADTDKNISSWVLWFCA